MLIYIYCFYLYCRQTWLDANCQWRNKRKRNRGYQRKRRRQRIESHPDSRRDNLEKERQRWKNRVQNKKVRKIGELGPREQRHHRKYWRKAQNRYKKVQSRSRQEVDTPPDSPLEQSMEEPTSSRRALANERQRRRTRKKHSREIQAMKEKIEKL